MTGVILAARPDAVTISLRRNCSGLWIEELRAVKGGRGMRIRVWLVCLLTPVIAACGVSGLSGETPTPVPKAATATSTAIPTEQPTATITSIPSATPRPTRAPLILNDHPGDVADLWRQVSPP